MWAILGALALLLLVQLSTDLRTARKAAPGRLFARTPIARAGMLFAAILVLPWVAFRFGHVDGILAGNSTWLFLFSVLVSAMISYTWYRYLTWLDMFERERFRSELLVFVLACGSTFLVWPLSDAFDAITGIRLNGELLNDFGYAVLGIGLIEEIVKLLPYMVIVLLTKEVNEPFDHLLYLSISALGFAFVENILYLQNTGLAAVSGRALFASVSHMFDSSIIGYSVAIALYRKRSPWLAGLLGLLLAALAHGFYDLWLLAPERPFALTLLFFLASIQLWVIMKNNLMNLSPRLQVQLRLPSAMFRYRIINGVLGLVAVAFLGIILLDGNAPALAMLLNGWSTMAALLLFLAMSFSGFALIQGHVSPVRVALNPIRLFLPVVTHGEDLTGTRWELFLSVRGALMIRPGPLTAQLPIQGTLVQRVVVDGDRDHYLFRPDRAVVLPNALGDLLLLKPESEMDTLGSAAVARVALFALREEPRFTEQGLLPEQFFFLNQALARIPPKA